MKLVIHNNRTYYWITQQGAWWKLLYSIGYYGIKYSTGGQYPDAESAEAAAIRYGQE